TRHYTEVAEASPIPVILYNVPVFTGIDMPASAIIELSKHPNIVGIKDSTSSLAKLMDLIKQSDKNFSVLVGNANLFFPGLLCGAQGAILALCNIAPQICVDIYQLYQRREYERAQDQVSRSHQLIKGVLSAGIPAIKAAMDLLGYAGGRPRSPFLPVDDKIQKEIKKHLKRTELL
ncbi:MAG: dihydrodipicolinate synthase family protein, partial [bacterium]